MITNDRLTFIFVHVNMISALRMNITKPFDILTFGDMCVDLIVNDDDVVPCFGQVEKLVNDYTLELGGSCCIFACQAAKLGLRVEILGRVGSDSFGQLIIRRLNDCGVDTHHVITDPNLKTGLGIALCQGNDRAILTYMGSINAIRPEDVTDDLINSAHHLHHGSYYLHTGLRPAIPSIFQRARNFGLTISLDTNWDPQEEWAIELAEILPLVNVFMPNEQEVSRITRQPDLQNAISYLHSLGVPLITVKQGEKGAILSDGQSSYSETVAPVTTGDSVGAGDSFDAGFLAGWLRGLSLEQSLKIACQCGQSVASKIGGLAGQPYWYDLSIRFAK